MDKLNEQLATLGKQLGEAQVVGNLGKHPVTTFQEEATSRNTKETKGRRRLRILSLVLNKGREHCCYLPLVTVSWQVFTEVEANISLLASFRGESLF